MNAYAAQYKQTGLATEVLEANPHRLVGLLLAGAIARLQLAEQCLLRGDGGVADITRKARAISEAGAIIGGLSSGLDLDAGGDIAQSLDALYDYMQRALVEANAGNDAGKVREVAGLLREIESAWNAIAPPAPAMPAGAQAIA